MPPYPILCYGADCSQAAAFKIAARWSDGITSELKTYSLACESCLSQLFRSAQERRDRCRLTAGETLEAVRIYRMERGERDRRLIACEELEARYS